MRNKEALIKRKRRSAVLAGLLVLVMLLTGTWAWQNLHSEHLTLIFVQMK